MDLADLFIIILPAFGAYVIAILPWTDNEIFEAAEFWGMVD